MDTTKTKVNYYHITLNNKEVINSILQNGLYCDEEGNIFVFENKSIKSNITGRTNYVSDLIANGQLGYKNFVMFEIDSEGITGQLLPDNVAEISARHQWIAKQPIIEPKYINYFGKYKTVIKAMF